jgi:glutamyl/glutaminyl-tRNA synthetase
MNGSPEKEFAWNRTRIAPTPSGYLHLGNIYSFVMTAALAKKVGAKVLLRIDDLDRGRYERRFVQDIFDTLDFLSIPWDEGPRNLREFEAEYSQLHRMEIYRGALDRLKESGDVFACICSRSQVQREASMGAGIRQGGQEGDGPGGLESGYPGICREKGISLDEKNTSWRLRTPEGREVAILTMKGEMIQAPLPPNMQDFVVRKKDGFPAYQLTSVLDDLHFGVDMVLRGQDLWPSTLAQTYLAARLGEDRWSGIRFYHHPLLTGVNGEKLSKSAGATSIQYLRKEGWKPADIFSMIAGMPGTDRSANSWETLLSIF